MAAGKGETPRDWLTELEEAERLTRLGKSSEEIEAVVHLSPTALKRLLRIGKGMDYESRWVCGQILDAGPRSLRQALPEEVRDAVRIAVEAAAFNDVSTGARSANDVSAPRDPSNDVFTLGDASNDVLAQPAPPFNDVLRSHPHRAIEEEEGGEEWVLSEPIAYAIKDLEDKSQRTALFLIQHLLLVRSQAEHLAEWMKAGRPLASWTPIEVAPGGRPPRKQVV